MHAFRLVEWTQNLSTSHPDYTFGENASSLSNISLYKRVKPKAHTSECAHFFYTIIILIPHITVLVVWSAFDPLKGDDTYVEHPGFIIIEERCVSDYAAVWFVLLLTYNILLSLAVVIVAIKSRKIRMSQFKDTKKVNFLIFSVLFVGCSTLAYTNIFTTIGEYHFIPVYILYFGHLLIAFLCQITLFVPKIWPPLLAKVSKKNGLTLVEQRQSLSSIYSAT